MKKRFIVACRQINKKIPDHHNAKENYHQFIRNKNIKSEIVACQPKSFENPNIADIKSVITEHWKTSHKLSKTIRQAKKVGSNRSLYSDTKNEWKVFKTKKIKK